MATESAYSDISLIFTPNPITGDVTPISDERAVKNALINLLRTPVGTKPFDPDYGTNIDKYVFEPADSFTESEINEEIAETVKKFEPRVRLTAIETSIEENGIDVRIEYYVVNVPGQQVLETTISRTT